MTIAVKSIIPTKVGIQIFQAIIDAYLTILSLVAFSQAGLYDAIKSNVAIVSFIV
jgi:hypothetical protein